MDGIEISTGIGYRVLIRSDYAKTRKRKFRAQNI